MLKTKNFYLCLGLCCLSPSILLAQKAKPKPKPYLHAPAVLNYARHDPNGLTILSSGRLLKPVGSHLPLAQWPHGLVVSPNGESLFIASENVGQFVTELDKSEPIVTAFPPGIVIEGEEKAKQKPTNAGAAVFSTDGKTLYWSSGESGFIYVMDVASHTVQSQISLNVSVNGQSFVDSYAMDVKLSVGGTLLFCADVTNFRVVVVDLKEKQVVSSIRVGRYPYALAVVDKIVYVANIGMFEYSAISAPDLAKVPAKAGETIDPRGLTFPPYGFPSKEARDGVQREGRFVPGLGNPNVSESFSVWGIDVASPLKPRVVAKIKTGLLVGAPADQEISVGGSGPNYLVAHGNFLYVSNNNNDTIEKINLTTHKIVQKIRIRPSPLVAKLRGVSPCGMVLSKNGSKLYVAELGINAIGIIDTKTGSVEGHIPTGWYPYRLAISNDGNKLYSIAFRGFGNGPKGAKVSPKSPYLGMKGALFTLDLASVHANLKQHTLNVLKFNGIVDRAVDKKEMASPLIPNSYGKVSEQIKYVVFIAKENHTFDAVFDRVPKAKSDPTLLRWGYHQNIAAPGQPTLDDVAVMVNHNKLARDFSLSDNFYMEPEASGVGHRWLVGVQPNNFAQMTYTLGWDFKKDSTAPGRRASFGSNGSIAPEDYPEAGSMWEHLARNGVPFRNYGEGFEFAGVGEDENQFKTGAREVVNIPMSKVLYDNTCRDFPIFNMNIPDQYRAYWFQKDFTELFMSEGKNPKRTMPSFVNIALCNDHGAAPKPLKGYPYLASWMADNDLALGRIVDFLSHTPYWKNMAIFVTQDDAGGEPDHIDAQRSVLMVISPWAKRGYVSHRLTTIVSMHRTLYEIFGLPPLNMFDALANDFSDCFTTKPDYRPYTHLPVDARIFDPEKAKDPLDPDYREARKLPSIPRDDIQDEREILRNQFGDDDD